MSLYQEKVLIQNFIVMWLLFLQSASVALHTEYHVSVSSEIYISISYFSHFFIVVQVQLSPFSPHRSSPPHWLPPPNLNRTPLWFVHGSFIHVPWQPSLFFPPLSPSLLPSGYCQFVLYFNVSHYILLPYFFCWLGSTYRWDHMIFFFHCLAYFT